MKSKIAARIAGGQPLMPILIAEALAANDRAKIRMGAIQAAASRAENPSSEPPDLARDCASHGLNPEAIASLIIEAVDRDGALSAPGLEDEVEGLFGDVAAMAASVAAGLPAEAAALEKRVTSLRAGVAFLARDLLPKAAAARLTSVSDHFDSVHRLVMDVHKLINRLAAATSDEQILGAHTYGLRAADKKLVQAFMRGLARTRTLKFDHPGLDTTAMRSGRRLVIQNDIGTTDAHVIIITVEGSTITVTYSDVHRARAKFFVGLFDGQPLEWTGLQRDQNDDLAEGESFYLITGRASECNASRQTGVLEAIGERLVFLIDWNKARKMLRPWIGKSDAVAVLDWAARHGLGHRAFLELGGADLVNTAIRHAAAGRIGFGQRLDAVLGRDGAIEFLKSAIRLCTEALLGGRSSRLALAGIEADLARRLDRADDALLLVVLRQLGLAREIAAMIDTHVAMPSAHQRGQLAFHAKTIEEKGDRIVVESRHQALQSVTDPLVAQLMDAAEDVIDELEQAAFVGSLLPPDLSPDLQAALAELSSRTLDSVGAAVRAIDAATEVPEGNRVDVDDALAAIADLSEIEHAADDAERAVATIVLTSACKPAEVLPALELGRTLERTTDRLAWIGHTLHRHVLADLSALPR